MSNTKTKGRRPDDEHLAQRADVVDDEAPQLSPEEAVAQLKLEEEARVAARANKMPTAEVEEAVAVEPVKQGPTPTPVADGALEEGAPTINSATARAIATLQQEVDDTKAELSRITLGSGKGSNVKGDTAVSYPWQLYRKPLDFVPQPGGTSEAGWLVIAPGGATSTGRRDVGSLAKYMLKGMKPITTYGPMAVPSKGLPGHGFVPMLEAGGAKEFPVAQILAYRWHVKPPIQGLVFPQAVEAMEQKQVYHFSCEECDVEFWFVKDDRYTLRACFTHLTKPESKGGIHAYRREEAAALLQSQGLPAVGKRAAAASKEMIEELAAPKEDA